MSDIIYLSAPETPTTPIREQLLSFALSAMASPDMPDHWHMLIDFASFGDEVIFSDGEPLSHVSALAAGRLAHDTLAVQVRVQLRGSAYQSNSGN